MSLHLFKGMVEPGEQISGTLKKEFMEEALAGLGMSPEDLKVLKSQVDALFQEGIEVCVELYMMVLFVMLYIRYF